MYVQTLVPHIVGVLLMLWISILILKVVIVSQGDINHHESLVKAIKQVDGVISALGSPEQIADQVKIVAAIKEAVEISGQGTYLS